MYDLLHHTDSANKPSLAFLPSPNASARKLQRLWNWKTRIGAQAFKTYKHTPRSHRVCFVRLLGKQPTTQSGKEHYDYYHAASRMSQLRMSSSILATVLLHVMYGHYLFNRSKCMSLLTHLAALPCTGRHRHRCCRIPVEIVCTDRSTKVDTGNSALWRKTCRTHSGHQAD